MLQIFESLEVGRDTLKVSFLQIYLETLYDLLAPLDGGSVDGKSKNGQLCMASHPRVAEALSMREDPTNGFFVQGLREYTAASFSAGEQAFISLEDTLSLVSYGVDKPGVGE